MNYIATIASLARQGTGAIFRPPTHSRRADARRRLARHWLWSLTIGATAVIALMILVDAPEIRLMPPRGTAYLWPVRILTDFGKSSYILSFLAVMAMLLLLAAPLMGRVEKMAAIGLSQRFAFLFLAVGVPVEIGELIKGVVGRARPFVGGVANPFNYSHFSWSEAYASFPSGHAIAATALAFGVSVLWPRAIFAMGLYAAAIIATRLVLLAHHPSDVVAGALLGILGVMFVRYWYASRHLLFRIGSVGTIHPLPGPGFRHLKGLPRTQQPHKEGAENP
ncbi:MAG: phosphatase PAP2 family protein [Xanthobacteraceae bacterium]|nr:phosphatase PAP2 family protein [Xanthobacteraceae bacterium]